MKSRDASHTHTHIQSSEKLACGLSRELREGVSSSAFLRVPKKLSSHLPSRLFFFLTARSDSRSLGFICRDYSAISDLSSENNFKGNKNVSPLST